MLEDPATLFYPYDHVYLEIQRDRLRPVLIAALTDNEIFKQEIAVIAA